MSNTDVLATVSRNWIFGFGASKLTFLFSPHSVGVYTLKLRSVHNNFNHINSLAATHWQHCSSQLAGHWARLCPEDKKYSANAPVGQKYLTVSANVTYNQSRIDVAPTDSEVSDGAGTSAQYLHNRQLLNDEIHTAGIALKEYFAGEALSPGKYSTLMFRRQMHMSFIQLILHWTLHLSL